MFIKRKYIISVCLSLLFIIISYKNVPAAEILSGRATVYSIIGTTSTGTPTRFGICASGNKSLLGKTVVLYQRLPDNSIGDPLGIYIVEDSGCKYDVIDIWCPKELQKMFINKTWEKGCCGNIYIMEVSQFPEQ